eukprot:2458340-Lingulodinium_polyedra.AAC.1
MTRTQLKGKSTCRNTPTPWRGKGGRGEDTRGKPRSPPSPSLDLDRRDPGGTTRRGSSNCTRGNHRLR